MNLNHIKHNFLILLLLLVNANLYAQKQKVMINPYADHKLYHLGFHIGINNQDLNIINNGFVGPNGEKLFAQIPSFSPGFSVGVIGDMYLTDFINLRFSPSIHFGNKNFSFINHENDEIVKTNVRSNYLNFPLDIKFSTLRLNNYRPYLLTGIFGSLDIGRKKNNILLMKPFDYGVEIGLGCNLYLPFFKLCPEIKFCFGLNDLIERNRNDLTDEKLMVYTNSIKKATSKMIILTFNFE